MRFAIALALLVAGCGSSRDRDDRYAFDLRIPDKHGDDDDQAALKKRIDDVMNEALQQVQPPAPTPTPDPPRAKVAVDPTCVASGTVTQIKVKGDRVLACIDTSGDSAADACVAWNRATGKFLEVQPVFDVEDDPATTTAPEAPEPDPEADDPRITQDGDAITACPEERVCERFMPLVKDGETIDAVRGDRLHRAVAVSISDSDNKHAHTEVWDLETGRMRARTKIAGLDADGTNGYSLRTYGDAFLSLAKRDDNSKAVVALLGLDGARHPLAGGSAAIVGDQIVEPAPGQIALLELVGTGKPFTVHVHAVPSGAGLGRFAIPFATDDDTATLVKMERGSLGVAQWKSDQLRIDVIDLRANATRAFKAPGC